MEPLWKGLKYDRLCNFAPEHAHQLNEEVLGVLEAIRNDQPRLRSFFHASDLPLPRASHTDKPKITDAAHTRTHSIRTRRVRKKLASKQETMEWGAFSNVDATDKIERPFTFIGRS